MSIGGPNKTKQIVKYLDAFSIKLEYLKTLFKINEN